MRRLAWHAVARVEVGDLLIDESIEAKLRGKTPPLTGQEVREVVLWSRDAATRWHNDAIHGWRLIVRGRTYQGRPIVAYCMPLEDDSAVFKLKTAWVEPSRH
jgi:hypothetical protein